MSQENADNKNEETPKKRSWVLWICIPCLLLCALYVACDLLLFVIKQPYPKSTMPITGTVVILDENGETIPFQPTGIRCFSYYASAPFRSGEHRKRNIDVDDLGKFNSKIPEFAAALFFYTEDEKYAAIVDISPDKPTTDLAIELRPRYTITGRLVDKTGTPLDKSRVALACNRLGDFGTESLFPFLFATYVAKGETFYFKETTTDIDGLFTMDNVFPGTKYTFSHDYSGIFLDMPVLQSEQYQQPFDLGDVSVAR